MYVDRTITSGLLMASDDVKSIEATTENSNGQISKARIALRPEASADYDDQEDVDLLYDQNLKDIPQVYTVAGNEAVTAKEENRKKMSDAIHHARSSWMMVQSDESLNHLFDLIEDSTSSDDVINQAVEDVFAHGEAIIKAAQKKIEEVTA